MEKITTFTICESIANMGPAPALVAPQTILRPQFIPGSFSFGIAVGISGVNLSNPNRIRFFIEDPNNKIVQDTGESELPGPQREQDLELEYQGFVMCIDIRNMPVEVEGKYKLNVFFNGRNIGEQIIPVFKRTM